jgi:hypothetical protein
MKRIIAIVIILVFLPAMSPAASKKHPHVSLDQACEECHEQEAQVWEDGKHGLMGVKCVVCHGDTSKNFIARPASERCVGCHAEQVAGTAEGHKIKQKNCWACHDGHSLKLESAK